MTPRRTRAPAILAGILILSCPPAQRAAWCAEAPQPAPIPITIQRCSGPITVDGDLSDPGWKGITPITTWFETNPGDNIEPPVRNVAYLAYDDKYLYAGFEFEDPAPKGIRAPLGDHDAVPSATDYAGVIVDSHNDGKTAQMFLSNPRGVQYDATTSDATGEDSSPDLLGLDGTHHEHRLVARDPHSVLFAAVLPRESADVGHPAVSQLPA